MRMQKIMGIALTLVAALLSSCAKEAWESQREAEGTKVVKMMLSPSANESETRSAIVETAGTGNRKVTWITGDKIYYWTSKTLTGTPSVKQEHLVLADAEKEETPVIYRDNDEYVTFYTAGTGVPSVTCTDMTNIKYNVPKYQDGTFASNHVAVYKSKVILGSGASADAAAMKPVASMLRFTMSTLTYAGKTVNKIKVRCLNASYYVWGDVNVEMDNTNIGNISSVAIVSYTGDNTDIIIDKTSSAFQVNTPYYVAIRPRNWDSGLYLDLYHDDTKLARVRIQNSSGKFELPFGHICDLGDIKDHVAIQTATAQMTIYPPYAAFTKDMTKKFWLRVEPDDFNGTVSWSVDDGTHFQVASGSKENLTLEDGTTVNCWTATVSPKSVSDYTRYATTVKATAKSKDGNEFSKSVDIEMGKFIDVGVENTSGQRTLWCYGFVKGSYDVDHYKNYGTDQEVNADATNTLEIVESGESKYMWGYRHSGSYPWGNRWETRPYQNSSDDLSTDDDVAYACASKYPGETGWRIPSALDFVALMNSCTETTGFYYTGRKPGFSDVSVYIQKSLDIHTRSGVKTGGSEFEIHNNTAGILGQDGRGQLYVKPVKYVSK